MSLWHKFTGGLAALIHKRRTEQEMDDELLAFVDASAEGKMRTGMSEAEARRAARLEMGSLESVKDGIRDAGWETAVEALWADLRYSVRVLRKSPLFTTVVVLTLALGIGANTAIFSIFDALILKTLPVERPEELVRMDGSFTNPLWEQLRDRQDLFAGAFAWGSEDFNLASGGPMHNAAGFWVSGDLFRTLGLRPAAGRLLTAADDRRGCAALAVLSYNFWRSRYGASPTAVGSVVSLNGHPFEIIGVAPAGFYGIVVGARFDVAVPICAAEVLDGPGSRLDRRSFWWLRAGGRGKPGMSMAQLRARLAAESPAIYGSVVPPHWGAALQDKFRKRVLSPIPMSTGVSDLRQGYTRPLGILMAVVALVLLIACANVASLFTARSVARAKEIAMRQALGASRLRLIRQLIVECLFLSLAGATLGVLFAPLAGKALLHSLSSIRQPIFFDFTPDLRVLGFTALIATVAGLLFGLAPALRCTRASLASAMKANHAAAGGPRSKLRLWIVSSQIALSLLLLVAAGLLLRTFRNLATADLGFDPDHVLIVDVNLSIANIPESQFGAVYDRIGAALRSVPGATSVARSSLTPLGGATWNNNIHSDVPNALTGDDALAYFNQIDPDYFEVLRTPLVAGRNFNRRDSAKRPLVAIVNQTLARKFFPGIDPVGHTFRAEGRGGKLDPPVEVVGVVKDAKYETVREEALPTAFLPDSQAPGSGSESFELRTPLPQGVIAKAIQPAIAAVNGAIPFEVHRLADQVDASVTRERALALLSAFFGGLALLLATIGLYGTLTYVVTQRRGEFGIRLALGATSNSILRLVMLDVVKLLALGVAAGVGLSLATTHFLRALLFGIEAHDPATLAIGSALMAAVSIAASLLAARRATKVDPMIALRAD